MPSVKEPSDLILQPPAIYPPESTEYEYSIQGVLRSLKRNRLLIIGCTLAGLIGGLVIAFLPRHYTAVSRVQVRQGSSSQYRVDNADAVTGGDDSTKLETQSMILESDSLFLEVAKKLNLAQDPDFMGSGVQKPADQDDPKAQEKLLARLHQAIRITYIPRTELIQVSCTTRSGVLSARVVNTLVAEYVHRLFESRLSSTQQVTKWLSSQLDDLKQQVEQDQENLIQLQSRLGIVGTDQSHDIGVTQLEDLTKAADEARVDRIVAEAKYRTLASGDSNLLEGGQDVLGHNTPNSPEMSLLANLRNQRAQAQARLSSLSEQFGPKYPEVLKTTAQIATLDKEINQEQARVLNQARQAYDAANNNEQNTVASLQGKKSEVFEHQNDMVQYQILTHDYESSRALYEGLMQRLRQAGIVAGLDSSEVDIVDMARVPGKPSDPRRAVSVGLGWIFGLAIGLMGAFLVSQFDRRVEDVSQIESRLGVPLLSITNSSNQPLENVAQAFLDSPNSPFVESMWLLRPSLMFSPLGQRARTVLFTSCNPGEGKSTFAAAQACALALRDSKVLLIDGDMRSPSLMLRFGLPNDIGLSSVLTGTTTLERAIQHIDSIPNLSVLTSGPAPTSPALLLGEDNLSALFEGIKDRFDFVVIDSPPVLGLADSSSLAQFAESIILVVSYGKFNRMHIDRAIKSLDRVGKPVTGIALNFADPDIAGAYGYGYAYPSSGSSSKNGRG
jgi:polysaccharide biosynthesis transport protein